MKTSILYGVAGAWFFFELFCLFQGCILSASWWLWVLILLLLLWGVLILCVVFWKEWKSVAKKEKKSDISPFLFPFLFLSPFSFLFLSPFLFLFLSALLFLFLSLSLSSFLYPIYSHLMILSHSCSLSPASFSHHHSLIYRGRQCFRFYVFYFVHSFFLVCSLTNHSLIVSRMCFSPNTLLTLLSSFLFADLSSFLFAALTAAPPTLSHCPFVYDSCRQHMYFSLGSRSPMSFFSSYDLVLHFLSLLQWVFHHLTVFFVQLSIFN
jgi:hypothetical protein